MKGSFRLAIDDTERTICIVGSSMSDDFFQEFLTAALDGNDQCDCEAQAALGGFDPCSGITIQVSNNPAKKYLRGSDVQPKFKPYLVFYLSHRTDGKPDFPAVGALLHAIVAC